MLMNRRSFLSCAGGVVAFGRKVFGLSPAASAIQPTCKSSGISGLQYYDPMPSWVGPYMGLPRNFTPGPIATKPVRVPVHEIPADTMAAIQRVIEHEAMLTSEHIEAERIAQLRLDNYFAGIQQAHE